MKIIKLFFNKTKSFWGFFNLVADLQKYSAQNKIWDSNGNQHFTIGSRFYTGIGEDKVSRTITIRKQEYIFRY